MPIGKKILLALMVLVMILMFVGCAPGNQRWDQDVNPGNMAGFWAGIWHGLIIIITFIVSLFTTDVGIYEASNTGWTYNLGFLIGLCFSILAPWRSKPWKWGTKRKKIVEKEWNEIGDKIEERVRKGLKSWLDDKKKEEKEKEWDEIAARIEEKIRKSLREWLDEK